MNKMQNILRDHDRSLIYSDDGEHVNHAVRRFFRCWLDGSYNGEEHYRRNVDYIWENQNNPRQLRMFVIREFVEYTARDYDCSYGYAQRCLTIALNPTELEVLTEQLIDDALDLISYKLEEE